VTENHTPGPWEASHRLNAIGQPLKGGRYVILQKGSNKSEDFFVAEMPFAACRGGDQREHEANARLIAAAPDMLAALKRVERDLTIGVSSDPLQVIRAAIAKAAGHS